MNVLARASLALALVAGPCAVLSEPPARSRVTGNGSLLFPFEEQILRARADCAARLSAVRSVGVVTPTVEISEGTTSGVVQHPEWSDAGRENVAASVEAALTARGLTVKHLRPPLAEEKAAAWREVTLLHDAVSAAVLYATYEQGFPAKLASFEYGVGDLGPLLSDESVDALLFASAEGRVSSGGKQVLGLLGGPRPMYNAVVQLSLVDRTGSVVWFEVFASGRSYDLRDRRDSDQLVRRVVDDLPGGKP